MEIGGYQIVRELGRGGMGVVYEALDPRTQQRVALKTVGFQGAQVPSRGLQRLQREAQALTQLSHPGLVPHYASGVGPQGYFLAMGLVEGTSLEDVLQRSGPLPLGRALQLMGDVGEALAYVHARGLLHRDIKPANVLLSTSGRVVLTDFGLVKLSPEVHAASQASLTRSGAMLGTPGYWPPEQAFGRLEQVGPASDVYSWAATLYALLSGQPPRAGQSLLEVLEAFDEPVLALRPLRPDVPPWLDALLERCLAREPSDRPPLGDALQELHSFGGSAGKTGGGLRLQLIAALALAASGLLGVGALVWALSDDGSSAARTGSVSATDAAGSSGPVEGDAGGPDPVDASGDEQGPNGDEQRPSADEQPEREAADWDAFETRINANDFPGARAHAQAWFRRQPRSALALRAVLQSCVLTARYAEGEEHGAALLERAPEDATAWGLYAVCLHHLDRDPETLAAAERSYQLDPRNNFGLPIYAQSLARAQRLEQAEKVFSELIALAPAGVFYAERACVRTDLGDVEGAASDVKSAFARSPTNSEAYYARGQLKLRKLDDPSGADDLLRALELKLPRPLRVLAGLGPHYVKQEDPSALLALLERRFANSQDPIALLWRATALLDLGRAREALPLTQALLEQRKLASDLVVHARALGQTGDVDRALTGFESVCGQLSPESSYYREAAERAALLALGNLNAPDRKARALRALGRWLEAAPTDLEALGMRIAVWASLQRYPEALAESERIAPLVDRCPDPTIVSRFYFSWSDALWRSGRMSEALFKLTHSLEHELAWLSFVQRGRVLAQLQHSELAEADFVRALELAPKSGRAWYYFMGICKQQGLHPRAAFAAERVIAFASPADQDKVEHARRVIETARSMR